MKRVEEWKLYVITDRCLSKGRTNEEVVCEAISGGADVIQFRDKEASTAEFYREAVILRKVTKASDVPFIINDRIDVARAVEADGVHLGQDDLPVSVARDILGPNKIVGISTHSLEQALIASLKRPDYISIGPIYSTKTKKTGPPVGVDVIRQIKENISIPIVAIGGITLETVSAVSQSGADCIALISSVVSADDIAGTVRKFEAKRKTFSTDEEAKM
ncbi:MAG: thiamine phosphate synthase [Gemmatimonadota bacterium]|nr:MAG: thiamine phosphate synthase [Gemmatimonadota bacterium]